MAKFLTTKERFDKNLTTSPFERGGPRPLPTRNLYALFNDGGHDLFRHGLSEVSQVPLDLFKNTVDYSPFGPDTGNRAAKEDPVMFGFDLIIRTQESPLFSSVIDESVQKFFDSNIVTSDEMVSRRVVWENFKKTFFQFFRSSYDTQPLGQSADPDNPVNSRFYYYLTKVTGLDGLVEANTMETPNSFVDYGKDMIKLDFTEDVTLRVGRMAALYKSLYWSRMSGKTMIPENLLRFDCDIIVSEVRNFVKLQNVLGDDALSGLQTLRDNVNRYVYTLYDCQLFFDKMPHGDVIDLATQPAAYEGYSVGFTYKHSTMRVDSFNPIANGYGSLNNGSYNPFSITPFDKFLNTTVPISSTNSTIGEVTLTGVIPAIIDVVRYNDVQTVSNDPNTQTNSNQSQSNDKTSDGMGTDSNGALKNKTTATGAGEGDPSGPPSNGNDINSVKTSGQSTPDLSNNPNFASLENVGSVEDIKKSLSTFEYDETVKARDVLSSTMSTPSAFKEANTTKSKEENDNYKDNKRMVNTGSAGDRKIEWEGSATPGEFKKKNEEVSKNELDANKAISSNPVPSKFQQANLSNSKNELDSERSGAPKESWLNSDSVGARFAKRIVNTGIAAVNQVIAKRTALLTKTLNTMATNVGYSSMLPPKNIYESDFNGELYLSSKLVRDSFENFVGESISNLFNKAKRPL